MLMVLAVESSGSDAAPRLLRPWLADLALNRVPMLQAHDAGTVYLNVSSDALAEVALRFARTQSGGSVTALLDCGARAFDWRPALDAASSALGFAHGPVFVNHSMEAAAREVAAWADAHAAEAEDARVLRVVADCGGACADAATAAFGRAGVPVVVGDTACAAASDYTLAAAMAASLLPGGGHALALFSCPQAPTNTYDDRLSCTGFFNVSEGETFEGAISECLSAPSLPELEACVQVVLGVLDVPDHFACYLDGSGRNASVPFERLRAWLAACAAVPLPSGPGQRGLLLSLQGCWAQNVQSTVLSFLHDSSLLLDDTRAAFNSGALLEWVAVSGNGSAPLLQNVNLVGLNNVCDGAGPALLAELRRRLPQKPAQR